MGGLSPSAAALVVLTLIMGQPAAAAGQTEKEAEPAPALEAIAERAEQLERLHTLIVAQNGEVLLERGFRGHRTDEPANIKSASKSVISALVGIAIEKGVLEGVDQKIAPLLRSELPDDPDPRLFDITIGNLLSMQSGLARTSGLSYGRWISSDNWVRFVLERDFVADPGGRMLYSTGSTHLLSAILTRVTGRSTLELARDWLAPVEGFRIADWQRDPQGIYLGGNQMAMTPRSLLAFGELYRNEGRAGGQQVVPREWITESWRRRTRSPFNGEGYGYSWFVSQEAGFDVNYAWGFGGQMLYIVPELELTVVMTSDTTARSAGTGYGQALRGLLADIIAVAERKGEARAGGGEAEPAE